MVIDELVYENIVGEGSFAIVVRYRDKDGKKFAVKRLKSKLCGNAPDLKRFYSEIQMLKKLKGTPNIVPIIEANVAEKLYIMPYADTNLQTFIEKNNQSLPMTARLEIFNGVLNAIVCAHQEQIIHRDITPNNVLRVDGIWLVADFGLGKDYSMYTKDKLY